jgi:hypothetical protein
MIRQPFAVTLLCQSSSSLRAATGFLIPLSRSRG